MAGIDKECIYDSSGSPLSGPERGQGGLRA